MFASDTNRAARALRILQVAEHHALDRQSLLDRAGLTEGQIQDPDSRIPVATTLRLWRQVANLIDDPDLGLEVGSSLRLREAGIVGYTMMHSETLLSALKRVVRFAKLFNQRADLTLEQLGDRWRLQALQDPLMPNFRQPIDEGIAGLMALFAEVVGRNVVAAEIHFNYGKPESTSEHRRLLGANLAFDQPRAAIFLWDRDVQTNTIEPDPHLIRYMDELAEIRLQELPSVDTYSGKVQQAVWPQLSEGPPPIEDVAARLATSTRSLQRRLREEGTSFAEVIDTLRHDRAQLLLKDPNLPVYEIGYLLGYSDPSTFHRAFRRWQGTSPRRFRAQQLS
jgi:AraC-like DNA-binding protein